MGIKAYGILQAVVSILPLCVFLPHFPQDHLLNPLLSIIHLLKRMVRLEKKIQALCTTRIVSAMPQPDRPPLQHKTRTQCRISHAPIARRGAAFQPGVRHLPRPCRRGGKRRSTGGCRDVGFRSAREHSIRKELTRKDSTRSKTTPDLDSPCLLAGTATVPAGKGSERLEKQTKKKERRQRSLSWAFARLRATINLSR